MTEGTNKQETTSAKKIPRKAPKREAKKNRITVEEEEEEEEQEKHQPIFGNSESEGSEEKESDNDYLSPSEDDEDDDLFGEDEINEIAATRHAPRQSNANTDQDELKEETDEVEKTKGPKTRLQKNKVVPSSKPKDSRSALDRYEEEYNEENEKERARSDDSEYENDESEKEPKVKDTKEVKEIKEVPEKDDNLAELTDYQRIQTRRMFIDKWISEPFFDEVVKGSFVRLFVGLQDGNHVYRMCEVLDVLPYKRPYRLPGTDLTVDRALLVGLGSSQKVAKMYHVSNSRISEKEFQFYVNTMKACREEEKLLRKSAIEKRRKKISDRLHHTYTDGEIQAMVDKNGAKNKALTTHNTNALRILEKRLSAAREEEDFDEMERLQKDIEKITREINLSKELYSKNYGLLTDLNKRNRALNLQLDAQAAERRRQHEQELISRGGAKNLIDPFARRDARPQILWVTGKKKNKETVPEKKTENPLMESIETTEEDFAEIEVHPEQIGKRIQDRYGFNPYLSSLKSRKERYLLEVCKDLPPIGEARENFRSGLSLAKYRSMCEEED